MNLNQNTSELQKLDSQHYLHPFTDPKALKKKGARVITRAEGIYLWDSDGEKILDGMAGLWCVNVGYGREKLARIAFEQMQELPYYNSFFNTTHPPAIALAKKLSEVKEYALAIPSHPNIGPCSFFFRQRLIETIKRRQGIF